MQIYRSGTDKLWHADCTWSALVFFLCQHLAACRKLIYAAGCLQERFYYSDNRRYVIRVADRPGMAVIVPELTHGVPCPGAHFVPEM